MHGIVPFMEKNLLDLPGHLSSFMTITWRSLSRRLLTFTYFSQDSATTGAGSDRPDRAPKFIT